jgi:hypothetical protein
LNRALLESALDEVIANQRGIDFQRIAIPLARHRCPQIVANEVTKDGGADGFLATVSLDQKRVLAVGCSITASWRKIRKDIETAKGRNSDLTAFWFYTAKGVTAELTDKWRESAKDDFGVSLTVFSREEIVQRLLEPQNQYLARLHLGIAAPESIRMDDTRAQLAQSAQRRIDAWLLHHMDFRLKPVPREYWTGDEHGGIRTTVTVEELAETLVGGGLFLISGEGGLGKTVALGQIASELMRRDNAPTPLLASASSWARSGQPLVPFLGGNFLGAGDVHSAAIQGLMTHGLVSVFLNGWNEVPTEHVQRLSEGLIDAKLAAPGCSIVLASRSSTGVSLGPLSQFNLSNLSTVARQALVEQLGPASVNVVFNVIGRDAEIEALSRLPLFLVPLVDTIVRGDAPPRHRHALLEAAITSIERMPDHDLVLRAPAMRARCHSALSRLAVEMSLRGTTEVNREEAVSYLAQTAGQDVPPDQLLETLVQHHVLVSEAGYAIRFQHQYFQDWFCAQHLQRLVSSVRDGQRDTLAPLLDDRHLDAAWGLMVAALADEPSAAGIANQLFRVALDVDLRLAAEWVPILGHLVQRESLGQLESRLRSWMAQGGRAIELSLRSVLAARSDDFADEFWRRLESVDQQVRLSTYHLYHLLEPFPVEVLGAEWRTRVGRWQPERRAEFAMNAAAANANDALELIKDFASRDPSPMVRGKCLAHIAFYDRSAAERLFVGATEESVAEILEYGTLDFLPREAVARHLPYIERLARTVPIDHLGSRALSYMREIEPARVVDIYKQQLSTERSDLHQQRMILDFIARYDWKWVGHWVIRRLIAFDYLPEDFERFLVDLENDELEEGVEQMLAKPDSQSHRLATALTPLLRLGRPSIVNRCLDELAGLGSPPGASENLTDPQRNRLYELERALRNAPLSTLVETFAARQETLTDSRSTRRAIDFLASSASADPDGVPAAGSSPGLALQGLVRQLGAIVFSAEDPEGHEKAALARLIGSTGYGTLRDLLQELASAESARVRDFFSAVRQQDGRRRSGAYMSHERWYVEAVSQAGGAGKISDLLKLFEDEVFEIETGQELVRLAGIPFVSMDDGIGSRTDWAAIAAEHRRVGERILSANARDIASAVQRHLTAWSRRTEPPVTHGSNESRVAALEVMHARLTGHLRAQPLLALASNNHSIYTIAGWLHTLLRCGITVPSSVADAALQTWLSHVNTTWHKPEDVVYLIKQFLIAFMFSDNLELAAERIRSLLPRLQPTWEARDILVPLAVTAISQRIELLLDALPDLNNESYWHEWAHAVGLLPQGDQREVLEALLTDSKWTDGRAGPAFPGQGIMEVLVPIVQGDDSLRRTLKLMAFSDSASARRDFARQLLVAMGDPDSAMAALLAALGDPALRPLAEVAILHARWHPHPDHRRFPDHNAPQALTAVRGLLLDTACRGDESTREWAKRLLVQIEAELEGFYPVEEPRHPDLASRLPWPIVEGPTSLH